ncbi:MAG TPA: sugar phosphate isomerase/epimerase family protein, partial [Tepidisphaeraceae bacterium]|nr:sugar phosphate isomerase/epimerase family protein [Tepidisphaeraceae bacterium]
MSKLAAFPKMCLDDLVLPDKSMTLRQWVEMAAKLDIDGLELYSGIRDIQDPKRLPEVRRIIEDHGMTMPMMCCSPDFTHPDRAFRQQQIELEKGWIDMTAALGGKYCRVLSGQRRPEVSREEGIRFAAESIEACIPHAAEYGITLILENHYKDNY